MNKPLHELRAATFWLTLAAGLPMGLAAAETAPIAAPPGFPAPVLESLQGTHATQSTARPLSIKGWKTLAGTKTLFIRTTELPMFDLHVSFPAGSARSEDQPSLAGLTFSLINEGVEGKANHADVSETFDGLGARLGISMDQERTAISLRSLSDPEKSAPALQLFSQVLGQPSLSAEALVRVKKELRGLLQAREQQPYEIASLRLKTLLAPETAFAHSIYGTQTSVESVTRQAIQDFHRQAYSARQAQITLIGDLTVEQAKAISLQIANALPDTPVITRAAPLELNGTERQSHVERAQEQTQVLFGQLGVARNHPDYAALYAAALIFGNGTNSRLITELRHKRGLVYGVYFGSEDWAGSGLATIALKTGPQFAQPTVALVRSMFSDYLRDGPTQAELDHVKRRVANESVLDRATNWEILGSLVEINRHYLPLDLDFLSYQVQQLTLAQIKTALKKHLNADQWRVVTVGPTVEQLPLPESVTPAPGSASKSMCRADASFVAS